MAIAFSMDKILLHSHQRKIQLYLEVVLKPNIEALLLLLLRFHECDHFFKNFNTHTTPIIYSNNQGVVMTTSNSIMHSRTSNFELNVHYVRYHV